MNQTALIIAVIAAAVALAVIAAWRSVTRRHIQAGGTLTWTFLALKWTVTPPPAESVPAAAEQPAVTAAPEWDRSAAR